MFEAYAPTDNVVRVDGPHQRRRMGDHLLGLARGVPRCSARDGVLVFSVGGGDAERNVSANLVRALDLARERGASVYGIVGGTGVHRPGRQRRASSSPRSSRTASRPTPRASAPWCGTCWFRTRRCKARTKWESVAGVAGLSGRAHPARSSSSAAPGSSVATPSTACSPSRRPSGSRCSTTSARAGAWHLDHHRDDPRLAVVEADVKELDALTKAMDGHDLVIHLASNPDIAAAMTDPTIDFYEGTLLTHHVAEAMRRNGVPTDPLRLGERRLRRPRRGGADGGPRPARPDVHVRRVEARRRGPAVFLRPYVRARRPRRSASATWSAPARRTGSGSTSCAGSVRSRPGCGSSAMARQSKSYIHVIDVLDAVFHVASRQRQSVRGLQRGHRRLHHRHRDRPTGRGGRRARPGQRAASSTPAVTEGWQGDVPVVRLDTTKIEATGWRCCRRPTREALRASLAGDGSTTASDWAGERARSRLPRPGRRPQRAPSCGTAGPTRRHRSPTSRSFPAWPKRSLASGPPGLLTRRDHQPARHRPWGPPSRRSSAAINDAVADRARCRRRRCLPP